MSERGPTPGRPADGVDSLLGGTGGEPMELSDEPFNVTPPAPDHGEEAPPARRFGTRQIVLASLLAVTLAGAAVVGTACYRIVSQKDAVLSIPDQVDQLRRDTSQDAGTTADYLRDALSAEVNLDAAVGAVFTDLQRAERSVLFFGGTTLLWTPESDLETAFELLSDDQGAVKDLHDVPAGKLGGTMKCGTTSSPEGDFAVCGWADHGSLALAMFPNRSPAEAATVLVTIREGTQTRS